MCALRVSVDGRLQIEVARYIYGRNIHRWLHIEFMNQSVTLLKFRKHRCRGLVLGHARTRKPQSLPLTQCIICIPACTVILFPISSWHACLSIQARVSSLFVFYAAVLNLRPRLVQTQEKVKKRRCRRIEQ